MRKTMTRWKKILSAVLVATMLITLIPDVSFTSYATEETEEEFCTDEMEEAVEDLKTTEDVEAESGEIYNTEKNEEEESASIDSTEEAEEEESASIDSAEESEEEESEKDNSTEETDEEESEEISETEKYEEKSEEPSETEVIKESEESTETEAESSESAETQEVTETETAFESEEETTEESVTEETTEEEITELVTEDVVAMEKVSLYAAQNSYVSVKNATHYTTYEFTTRLNQVDNQDIPGAVTYIIPDAVKQNILKVTSTNGYEPVVKTGDKTLSPSGEPEVIVNMDKISVTATYKVNTADIASRTIEISEQQKTVKLTVKYNKKYVEIDAIANGRRVQPTATSDGMDAYIVNYCETLELIPKGLAGATVISVKNGDSELKEKDGKYTIKPVKDEEITISHHEGQDYNIDLRYKFRWTDKTDSYDGTSVKDTINYHGTYTLTVKNAEDSQKVSIDPASVSVTTNKKGNSVEYTASEESIELKPLKNPGEVITVKFKAQGKDCEAKFTVRKEVKSIKVKGAQNGVIKSDLGVQKNFELIISPADADTSAVWEKYESPFIGFYNDATKTLIVNSFYEEKEGQVTFTDAGPSGERKTVGTVKVRISDENITKAKPLVKVDYITDTELKLSIDKPNVFDFRFRIAYYVKVEAIVSANKPLQKNMKESIEGYYNSSTKEIKLKLAKDNVATGKGVAQDYKVSVYLVQNMEERDGEIVPIMDKGKDMKPVFSTPVEFKVSTRNPYYEDKLTLNRKVDKIYAGDKPVCVAEAQFSKNASYCMLRNPTVISVPSTVENKEVIRNRLTDLLEIVDNTKLYVNRFETRYCDYDYSGIPEGKYKVQVEALAADGMEPVRATVEFTVVEPYGSERITFPSHKLFKQPGKAASMTGTVKWISKGQHKTMTWVVEPNFSRYQNPRAYDALVKYVTIKNGTIRVDKSFVLDADSKYNTVAVSIETEPIVSSTGTVFKLSRAAEYIEITNAYESLDSIGFYSYLGGGRYELKYAVTEKENKPIDILYEDLISDRQNMIEYKIVPFHGAAPETIVKENLAEVLLNPDFADVKYSSSNKNFVDISAYGEVNGVKTGTGKVTFTVETTVGPKQSKNITFNIINAKPKQLGLQIDGTVEKVLQPHTGKTQAEIKECTHAVFFSVQQLTGTNPSNSYAWSSISNNTKHSLTVSGGKIVYKDIQTGIYVVRPTKEDMKVTLKDDTNKKTYVYQIKVNSCSSSLPTVKPQSTTMNVLLDKDGYIMPGSFDLIFPKGVAAGTTDFEIMADWAALTAKDKSFYEDTFWGLADINKKEDDKFTITYGKGKNKLKPATYKCYIYPINQNGVSTAKPFTLTIKLIEQKGSFSPTTSYTMKLSVSKLIEFTGKQKNIVEGSLKIIGIQNVNVNGQPNHFTNMFTIDNTNKKLELIGSEAELRKSPVQGYVTYTCTGVNGEVFTNTVKVTIKAVK